MMKRLIHIIVTITLFCAAGFALADQHFVVTGSFQSSASASTHQKAIGQYFPETSIETASVNGELRFRVLMGPFATAYDAKKTQQEVIESGFNEAWVYSVNTVNTVNTAMVATSIDDGINDTVDKSIEKNMERISKQSKVHINHFAYSSPVLKDEIAAILTPLEGTDIPTAELLAIKDEINQLYVANGFINSGVLIPDQQIKNGELKLEFISGVVTEIQLDSALRKRYVQSRLEIDQPFSLTNLQQSLKLLEQDPLVTRIDAKVAPGLNPGEASLALKVETRPRFQVDVTAANDRSPSIGSENGRLNLSASNLTGWGESLQVGSSVTRGLDAFDASISLPLTSGGTSLALQYSVSDSSVIEEPFDQINVDSETESLGLMLNLPIHKSLTTSLALQLTLEARRNQTSLLGQPFSFSEGAINGESRVAPVRLAIAYTEQNINDSLAARLLVSRGTSALDATQNTDQADGLFTSYLGQIQYSKLLAERIHITARALAQHAADPLLSVEKYALGGVNTVRGYRQNQVVRDNAYLASLEAHYRPDWPIWVDLMVFLDWGSGENHSDAIAGGKTDLSSVGLGMIINGWHGFSLELYIARGFEDFTTTEYDLQDDGIHFKLGYHHEF
jgi:hemolysin activation/secretion protein